MNRQQICEYSTFSNPYTGLAAMILFQAGYDLQALGTKDKLTICGYPVVKAEVKDFFRSRWATVLASCCGVDDVTYSSFVRRIGE